MVKVRSDYPVDASGEVDLDLWLQQIRELTPLDDPQEMRRACEFSREIDLKAVREDRLWSRGASSFRTGLEMARILAELRLDQESMIAAILYRAVREERVERTVVADKFGKRVATLIDGVLQMAAISALHHPIKGTVLGQQHPQIDNVRKMLVAMVDDVRVPLIKLAERTCAIRAVKDAPTEKRMRVAREVFDIYAPLAHRLGIGHIKWELEDLSFRYLHDTAYKKIARQLDEKRIDRDQYIGAVKSALNAALAEAGIKAEVTGRAKHIYSIWRKMRRKGIEFSQVYDIRAFRVLVPEVRDCYAALGIIHSLWRHIPHEFDDYIANPKENGYQSLHTAVIGPEGRAMEVQIRTQTMHDEAELGVCAHWLYKGTDTRKRTSASYEEKISWLRQVLEWQDELGDAGGLVDQWRTDTSSDRVYVFTPDGHVVDLPQGATSVDFAYRVHTEVGHACRGAKVNGRIVPLTHPLRTGDQVTILTSNNPQPSRDWLNPSLGYIQTSRARAKLTHWFKSQDRDRNIVDGRAILEDELKRLSISGVSFDELAKKVNYRDADDMFAAIGAGDLKPTQVATTAQNMLEPHEKQLDFLFTPKRAEKVTDNDIQVRGVGQLKTIMANCCHPVPGDAITGYITVGRGVSIHRQDCMNLLQLAEQERNRIIEVSWGRSAESVYPVEIEIVAYDRSGLLRDITNTLANLKVNVLALQTRSDTNENTATMQLTIEVPGLDKLARLLAQVRQLPNIMDVRRRRS